MGDIAKRVGVDLGVGSVVEEVCVAGELALSQKSPTEPPNGRIEPVKETGQMGQRGHPQISSLNVAEFVKKGHAKGFGGPG